MHLIANVSIGTLHPSQYTIYVCVLGGMQDWNYFYTNDLELTIEQGCIKYPMGGSLKSYWDSNKYAYLTYIVQVRLSVRSN